MANLFDGIERMTDNQILIEIGLFSQVNVGNAAIETGNRVLGGVIGMANSLVQSFGKNTSFAYEVIRVSDMVSRVIEENRGKSREQLLRELTELVAQKSGVQSSGGAIEKDAVTKTDLDDVLGRNPDGNADTRLEEELNAGSAVRRRERIALSVVEEASATYGIQKYDTPANKIEKVSIQYNKAFLEALHGYLARQESEAALQTNRSVQKRLDAVPLEAKRELQRRIFPKEFSGTGICRVLRTESGVKYLTYAVEILGPECFGEVQAHVAAVLSSMKTLRKMSRVLLAQLVWQARRSYGKEFTVDRRILPSYAIVEAGGDKTNVSDDAYRQEVSENGLRELLAGKAAMEKKLAKCAEAVDKNKEQQNLAAEKRDKLEAEFDKAKARFEELEKQKDRYVSGRMPENDTKKYFNNVNETKRQLDNAQAALEKQQSRVQELDKKANLLEQEYQGAAHETEETERITAQRVRLIAGNLRKQWKAFYFRFAFEEEVFETVAQQFWSRERLNIEEMLKELHDSKELAECKSVCAYEKEAGRIFCAADKGKNAVIVMEGNKIITIERI